MLRIGGQDETESIYAHSVSDSRAELLHVLRIGDACPDAVQLILIDDRHSIAKDCLTAFRLERRQATVLSEILHVKRFKFVRREAFLPRFVKPKKSGAVCQNTGNYRLWGTSISSAFVKIQINRKCFQFRIV